MGKRVAIVGIGFSKFRTTSQDVNYREMIFDAATKCYEDAGVKHPREIDAFVASSEDFMEGVSIADEYVPDQLGGAMRPVESITGDGLQGLAAALMQVQTGEFDLVATSAFSKASNVQDYYNVVHYACDPTFIRPLKENPYFIAGLEMQRYLYATGTTREQCAKVAAKNMENALINPYAVYGGLVTEEDVMNSPLKYDPLRQLDISGDIDGAIVLLLASEEKARELNKEPIFVNGIGWATDSPNLDSRNNFGGEAYYAKLAGEKAYKMAGIKSPKNEIDFAEIDDTFTYKELQHIEALSLCSPGDAGNLMEQGAFSAKGDFPVNVSGGNLGVGYLHEANGLQKVMEIVLQLRGEAGKRQLDGVKTGLAFAWRGIPTATGVAAVLSKE